MSGKYELTADRSGGYVFKLKAHNGQVLMTSESYQTKADALKGIEIVRRMPRAASSTSPSPSSRPDHPD